MGVIGGRILRDELARDGSGKAFVVALEYDFHQDQHWLTEPPPVVVPPVAAPPQAEETPPAPQNAPSSLLRTRAVKTREAEVPPIESAPAETPETPAEAPVAAPEAPAETPVATPEVPAEPAPVEPAPAEPAPVEPAPAEAPAVAPDAPTETPVATPEVPAEPAETPAATPQSPVEAAPTVAPVPPVEPIPQAPTAPLRAPQNGEKVRCKIAGDGALVAVLPWEAKAAGFDHAGVLLAEGDRWHVVVSFAPLSDEVWRSETTPAIGLPVDCVFDGTGKLASCSAHATTRRGVVLSVDSAKDAFIVRVLPGSHTEANWRLGSALAAVTAPSDFAEEVCLLSREWKGSCPPQPGMTVDCEYVGAALVGVRQGPKYWAGVADPGNHVRRGNLLSTDNGLVVSVEDDVVCDGKNLGSGDRLVCAYEYGRAGVCTPPDYEKSQERNAIVLRHWKHGTRIARRYHFDQKRHWKCNDVSPKIDMMVWAEFDKDNNLISVRPLPGVWRGMPTDGLLHGRIHRMPKGLSPLDLLPLKTIGGAFALFGWGAVRRFAEDEERGRVSADIDFGAEQWVGETPPVEDMPVHCLLNECGRVVQVCSEPLLKKPTELVMSGKIRRATGPREGVVTVVYPFGMDNWKGGKRKPFLRREVYSEFDENGRVIAVRPMAGEGWSAWELTRLFVSLGSIIYTVSDIIGTINRSKKLLELADKYHLLKVLLWPVFFLGKVWDAFYRFYDWAWYQPLARLFCWLDPNHVDPSHLYKNFLLLSILTILAVALFSSWKEQKRTESGIRLGIVTVALLLLHAWFWSGYMVERSPRNACKECHVGCVQGGGPSGAGAGTTTGGGKASRSAAAYQFYFDYKKSVWFADSKFDGIKSNEEWLDVLVGTLGAHEDTKVIITGHTDAKGSGEFNFNLSLCRAKTVQSLLETKGIKPERIAIQATAFTALKDTTDPNNGQNRRVVAVVVTDPKLPTGNTTLPYVDCKPFE